MDNRETFQPKDYYSNQSSTSFSPYYSNQNIQPSQQPTQNSNYLFSQYGNSGNFPSYTSETPKQNYLNPSPSFTQNMPSNNNMQNFELMQNMIKMFGPQMFQSNQNANPMDFLVNAGKLLMAPNANSNLFSQTPQSQKQTIDFKKPENKSVNDVFSSNMSNLNQFYQFINNQQAEYNTSSSQELTPSKLTSNEDVHLPSKSDFQSIYFDPSEDYHHSSKQNSARKSEDSFHRAEPGFLTESTRPNKAMNRSTSPIPGPQKGGAPSYSVSVAEPENKKSPQANFDDMPIKNSKGGVLLNFDDTQANQTSSIRNHRQINASKEAQNKDFSNRENFNRESAKDSTPTQAKKPVNFDDMPIKGAKQAMNSDDFLVEDKPPQKFDDIPFKSSKAPQNDRASSKQPASFDDMPIKSSGSSKMSFDPPRSSKSSRNEDRDDSSSAEPVQRPQYSNPFDEKPVGGGSSGGAKISFNEMENKRETKTQEPKKKVEKKPFLKKGSRVHLSSAADRPFMAKTDSNKDLADFNDGFEYNAPAPKSKSVSRPSTSQSNNAFSNQGKTQAASKAEPSSPKDNKSKETKKFLSRGQGRGGGKGNVIEEKPIKETVERKPARQTSPSFDDLLFDKKPKKKTVWDDEDEEEEEEKVQHNYEEEEEEEEEHENKRYWDDEDPEEKFEDEEEQEENQSAKYDFEKYTKSSAKKSDYAYNDKNEIKFDDEEAFDSKNNRYDDGEVQTSSLVDKYFYGNKNKKQKKEVEKAKKQEANEKDEKIKAIVNEKIEELNNEIAKFKLENERLRKLKLKQEEMLRNYNRDMNDWAKNKDTQLEEFESWKSEEIKKINKDKRVADRNSKALQNMPNRKEREEIETLKKQVSKLQEDVQIKDKRHKLTVERMKKQVEELNQRHGELNEELKVYDKYRDKPRASTTPKGKPQYYDEEEDEEEQAQDNEEEQEDEKYEEEERAESRHDEDDNEVIKEEDEEEEEDDQEDLRYEDILQKSNSKGLSNRATDNKNNDDRRASFQNRDTQSKNYSDRFSLATLGENYSSNKGDKAPIKEYETPRGFGTNKTANVINKAEPTGLRNSYKIDDYNFDSNQYYKMHVLRGGNVKLISQVVTADNKIQKTYADGKKEVVFHNGVRRESYPDGYTIVHFTNQDIKQTLPDNTIIYFFADAQTCQTTLPTGQNIYKFANNQIEFHNNDGSKEIYFSDGTKKSINANDEEETIFSDGTIQRVNAQKIKTVLSPNGQKEVIYPDGSRVRTQPDGKVVRLNA